MDDLYTESVYRYSLWKPKLQQVVAQRQLRSK
jgi:hypothetical protein